MKMSSEDFYTWNKVEVLPSETCPICGGKIKNFTVLKHRAKCLMCGAIFYDQLTTCKKCGSPHIFVLGDEKKDSHLFPLTLCRKCYYKFLKQDELTKCQLCQYVVKEKDGRYYCRKYMVYTKPLYNCRLVRRMMKIG